MGRRKRTSTSRRVALVAERLQRAPVATSEGDGGEGERPRPEIFTAQARFVLAVWCAVTLVLVVIYVVVLLLL
jgi:hypothetical protein